MPTRRRKPLRRAIDPGALGGGCGSATPGAGRAEARCVPRPRALRRWGGAAWRPARRRDGSPLVVHVMPRLAHRRATDADAPSSSPTMAGGAATEQIAGAAVRADAGGGAGVRAGGGGQSSRQKLDGHRASTLKTHLLRVFDKTGPHHRAELVARGCRRRAEGARPNRWGGRMRPAAAALGGMRPMGPGPPGTAKDGRPVDVELLRIVGMIYDAVPIRGGARRARRDPRPARLVQCHHGAGAAGEPHRAQCRDQRRASASMPARPEDVHEHVGGQRISRRCRSKSRDSSRARAIRRRGENRAHDWAKPQGIVDQSRCLGATDDVRARRLRAARVDGRSVQRSIEELRLLAAPDAPRPSAGSSRRRWRGPRPRGGARCGGRRRGAGAGDMGIVHANAVADAMLRAAIRSARRAELRLVEEIIPGSSKPRRRRRKGRRPSGGRGSAFGAAADGSPLVTHVMPLNPGSVRGRPPTPSCSSPTTAAEPPTESLELLFRADASRAQVFELIAAGIEPADRGPDGHRFRARSDAPAAGLRQDRPASPGGAGGAGARDIAYALTGRASGRRSRRRVRRGDVGGVIAIGRV